MNDAANRESRIGLGGPVAWMVRNPITANLLTALILVGGLWSSFRTPKEVFPQFLLDVVEVSVSYPGAAPEDVERGILAPVEEAIRSVEGVREISSEAREGFGVVAIELVSGTNRMKALQDVDQAIDRIRTFPDDIDQPEVVLQSRETEAISIGIYGSVDIWSLRKTAEQTRDQLLAHPAITRVDLTRVPDYMTHVEIPRDSLREYGLTLGDVAGLIEATSEDVAAGAVQSASGEVLLRVNSRRQWATDFEEIRILAGDDGSVVTLGDIATIQDGFAEDSFHSQFNQQPSVEMSVFRTGVQSPMDVANAAVSVLADIESTFPNGLQWRVDGNNAEEFQSRLKLVLDNGLIAIAILLVLLTLFLEIRLAFWLMVGMVLSFVAGLMLLPSVGQSINMISLFGFLVALGIVVDDAIVIGENVYEHRLKGKNSVRAAIDGTKEVAGPVTFSVLTSIVAFIPLAFIPGETGNFWRPLPIIVIVVLAASLLEALFILPAHIGHVPENKERKGVFSILQRVQRFVSGLLSAAVKKIYKPVLRFSIHFRYITAVAAIAALWISVTYSTSAHMGLILMPEVSADEIEGGVRLPVSTTPDQAAEVADAITSATMRMFEEHNLHDVAEGVTTNVRGQNFIDVEMVMLPPDQRDMTAGEVIELWRDSIGDLPGIDQISFEAERGPGGHEDDISIDLGHNDIDVLENATAALVERAEQFTNTRDVGDSYNSGKAQLDFTLLPEGRALGLTPADVGEQVRGAFFGSLAFRLLRSTNEIEVRVKLPEEEREDIHNLQKLVIRTPAGAEVPLLDVVEIQEGEAFSSISRRNGRRIVNVSMDVEPKRAVGQVITALQADVLPELRDQYPGLTWSFEGSDADLRESTVTLWGGFGIAVIGIYALLAVAFKSYIQPFVVLAAVPFGAVGAVLGHMLLGYDLSLVSMMGVVALSGVVVNDSLLMVDYANKHQGDRSALEAIIDAGLRRFRPIFLTTVTTFLGLSPLIFEDSLQAQYVIPMAISLGFGIVFATAIVLVLVPCLYVILEDTRTAWTYLRPRQLRTRSSPQIHSVE